MADKIQPTEEKKMQDKVSEKKIADIVKSENKVDNIKHEQKQVEPAKPVEPRADTKSVEKKDETPRKTEAVANGVSVRASKRHCMYIGSFIKGKTVDAAISDLNAVIAMKKIVPFKGEIPHRKGRGMMSGRYPVNASKIFIAMLKGLRGNIIVNNMDLDKTRIVSVVSNWASRPRRSSGKAKRAHIEIIARQLDAVREEKK